MECAAIERRLNFFDPSSINITRDDYNVLDMYDKCSGEQYTDIEIKLMFPLTHQSRMIGIYQDGKEIGLIQDYGLLGTETRTIVLETVEKRYFRPVIKEIHSITEEMRMFNWKVETDKGYLEFIVRTRNDVVVKKQQVYIRDLDGNMYVIKDSTKLDVKSRKVLNSEI